MTTQEHLDRELAALVRRSRRVIWVLLMAVSALLLLALAGDAYLLNTAAFQRTQLHTALCTFDQDLASAPLANNPATGRPSILGTRIVADSWNAFKSLNCDGLLAPNPSLVKWANYYRIPLR